MLREPHLSGGACFHKKSKHSSENTKDKNEQYVSGSISLEEFENMVRFFWILLEIDRSVRAATWASLVQRLRTEIIRYASLSQSCSRLGRSRRS